MLVKYAMVEEPLQVSPKAGLRDILHLILETNQDTAAVVDADGSLVGVVGAHDVLRKIVPLYVDMDEALAALIHDGYFEEHFATLKDVTAADIVNTEVDTVGPDNTLIQAATLFLTHHRRALPVIDGGKVVGMITRQSLFKRVSEMLSSNSG
jgi:CBS domain-containing protein